MLVSANDGIRDAISVEVAYERERRSETRERQSSWLLEEDEVGIRPAERLKDEREKRQQREKERARA